VVAVIDSGVQAGNPLLAPAAVEALSAVPAIPDGSDEADHGSLVTSLALYGSLEGRLDRRDTVRAAGKLLGIRVLDAGGNFLDDRLWQRPVDDALELAVAHDARVVNLSIGDPSHPYRPPAPVAMAAVLDAFAREHDAVVVVSAGDIHWEEPPGPDYAHWLLTYGGRDRARAACDVRPRAHRGRSRGGQGAGRAASPGERGGTTSGPARNAEPGEPQGHRHRTCNQAGAVCARRHLESLASDIELGSVHPRLPRTVLDGDIIR
jgi:hypothetical protein